MVIVLELVLVLAFFLAPKRGSPKNSFFSNLRGVPSWVPLSPDPCLGIESAGKT
jgi:hypothetical protein